MYISKPYPEYKIIDLPWLDQIPAHWKMVRIKTLLTERVEKNHPDEPLLAATQTKGVIRKDDYENRTVLPLGDLQNLKLVKENDFVISLRSFQGGIEYAREQGIISPAYTVLEVNNPQYHGYLSRLFKSKPFIENLTLNVTGIRQGQNIDYERLSRSYVPLPPLEEQNAIVRYLDYMDNLIKRYIRIKKKEILLLDEQKRAIICSTVLHRQKDTTKVKDSGVAWIGNIPTSWRVLPGKSCFLEKKVLNTGLLIDKVLSLSYGKIIVKPEDKLHGLVPLSFETYQIIDKGDIIVRSTDLQNDQKSLRFGLCTEKGIITSAYMCLQTTNEILSEYGYYLLHTYDLLKIIYGLGSGLRQNLGWKDIKYLPCVAPPISDQQSIVGFLDNELKKYDSQIEFINKKIKFIHEYQEHLFSTLVTGALDISDSSNNLPIDLLEEVYEIEPEEKLEVENEDESDLIEEGEE